MAGAAGGSSSRACRLWQTRAQRSRTRHELREAGVGADLQGRRQWEGWVCQAAKRGAWPGAGLHSAGEAAPAHPIRPPRAFTLLSRLSHSTCSRSLCFVMSHMVEPSNRRALETGLVPRSCPYSGGGSPPPGRAMGKSGWSSAPAGSADMALGRGGWSRRGGMRGGAGEEGRSWRAERRSDGRQTAAVAPAGEPPCGNPAPWNRARVQGSQPCMWRGKARLEAWAAAEARWEADSLNAAIRRLSCESMLTESDGARSLM